MVNRSGPTVGLSARRLGLAWLLLAMMIGGGCKDEGIILGPLPVKPVRPAIVVLPGRAIDKIDILLTLDNSRSMGDKQLILAAALPDLLGGIINPPCVDGAGAQTQPSGPEEACPAGSRRRAAAINDVHVGVVTTSLGGHGSDACPAKETTSCVGGATNTSGDDAGRLVNRQTTCGAGIVPTYQGLGFLAWDPAQKLVPAGEKEAGAIQVNPSTGAVDTVTPGLVPTLKDLVVGAGQIGCGFESQLESWYRFLVEPSPHKILSLMDGMVVPVGVDDLLLKQRADFLRSSSVLLIVLLTDEDDCSLIDGAASYLALQGHEPADPTQRFYLTRARQECATHPDDVCCRPCWPPADGCPEDPTCASNGTLDDPEDALSLRCWDQKRRFGLDFLRPIDRYRNGLHGAMVADRDGIIVPNPIFSDLSLTDGDRVVRDRSQVLFAGIVGVPWQDLARDPQDLTKGFKRSSEYSITDAQGHTTWDTILGDPRNLVPPQDPHMRSSVVPREGLSPPGSAADADPVHGHEYSIPKQDDLQYACVFDLPAPRDCAADPLGSCDCQDPAGNSPICDPSTPTLQIRARAYPGTRELDLLERLGEQGVVASVCPAQLTDPSRRDYGYRPAMDLITERVADIGGRQACLSTEIVPDGRGLVTCTVIEARTLVDACVCDPAQARRAVKHPMVLNSAAGTGMDPFQFSNCFCEVVQAGDPESSTPEALAACEGDTSPGPKIASGANAGSPANGWCYVDPAQNPASNPDLVLGCPPGDPRVLRVVGAGQPVPGGKLVLVCGGI